MHKKHLNSLLKYNAYESFAWLNMKKKNFSICVPDAMKNLVDDKFKNLLSAQSLILLYLIFLKNA